LTIGGGFRFLNIPIPKGWLIEEAYISWCAQASKPEIANPIVNITGHDHDSAPPFTTYQDFDSRERTDAFVLYNLPEVTINEWYNTTDIKSIIQELVNRDGWVSGNNIVLFHELKPPTNNAVYGYTFDKDSSKAPILYIRWGPPIENPKLLFGAGFNGSTPVVDLYWKSNLTDITLFEVQDSTDKVSWDYLGTNTTTEYHDFEVINGAERYYRVRGCNFTGDVWDNSTWSNIDFETVYFIKGEGGIESVDITPSVIMALFLILVVSGLIYGVRKRR